MEQSNIIIGSNVYLIRNKDIYKDDDFIAQIKDYKLLKRIAQKAESGYKISRLSNEQEKILENGIRCAYAKNDPCWGFGIKTNKMICACINGKCPNIFKCNPNYSDEDANFWTTSYEDREKYGDDSKMTYYYIVDMISDEEMDLFNLISKGSEPTYPVSLDSFTNEDDYKYAYRNNPITGKKEVIIGYRWKIVDNASYEGEKLFPIWGYVDEIKERKQIVSIKKTRKIEKKSAIQNMSKDIWSSSDTISDTIERLEKNVLDHVKADVKISNITDLLLSNDILVVVFDNQAELAFASCSLLLKNIEHGIKTDSRIKLILKDDYNSLNQGKSIIISNSVLEKGCSESALKSWELLSKKENIIKLYVPKHDYYMFLYRDRIFWTCRNMYGITHIYIDYSQIKILYSLQDGLYHIRIIDKNGEYIIEDEYGKKIGNVDLSIKQMLNVLIDSEEVPGFPEEINGLAIKVESGKTDLLGMGHLIFSSY